MAGNTDLGTDWQVAYVTADRGSVERDRLIAEALELKSLRQVAEIIGVSHTTVARARDRHLSRQGRHLRLAPRADRGGSPPPGVSRGD